MKKEILKARVNALVAEKQGLMEALRCVLEVANKELVDANVKSWATDFCKKFGITEMSLKKANRSATRGRVIPCISMIDNAAYQPCKVMKVYGTEYGRVRYMQWTTALAMIDLSATDTTQVVVNTQSQNEYYHTDGTPCTVDEIATIEEAREKAEAERAKKTLQKAHDLVNEEARTKALAEKEARAAEARKAANLAAKERARKAKEAQQAQQAQQA